MKKISHFMILMAILMLSGTVMAERVFFAFDNGLTRTETLKDKASVLKELGYSGIGSRSGAIAGLMPEINAAGLKIVSSYVPLRIQGESAVIDPGLAREIELFKGHGTFIWLYITGGRKGEQDDIVVDAVKMISDMAEKAGLQVSIYPHAGFYVATALEAFRIAEKVDRANVGCSFNLCHFLMQNDIDTMESVLRKIAPRLNLVSINGADNGSRLPLDKALQRLDLGSFDNAELLKLLDKFGYQGPVGLQCYNIKGDDRENLKASMEAWQKIISMEKGQGDK